MVRIRMILVALITIVATPNLFAAWKVVIDKNCIKVVSSNLASQKLIEGQHNQRLDSIAEKKKKVELYTVSMATIKELYKVTMQNVSASVRRANTTRRLDYAHTTSSKMCRNLSKR